MFSDGGVSDNISEDSDDIFPDLNVQLPKPMTSKLESDAYFKNILDSNVKLPKLLTSEVESDVFLKSLPESNENENIQHGNQSLSNDSESKITFTCCNGFKRF